MTSRCFLDDPARAACEKDTTVDADNGRIETRVATVSTDIAWLQDSHHWPGLAAIGKVVRTREAKTKTKSEATTQTAYYLLSNPLSPKRLNRVVRAHWGIENRLHWRLDVIMNEDQARNRSDNGPYNLAILRHMAINVMQKEGSKGSLRGKFKRAGWDDKYLTRLLALF
jgi:predicted transposase YbfD/YdcC